MAPITKKKTTLSGHEKSVGVLAPKKTSALSKALSNLSANVISAVTPKTTTKTLSNAKSNFTNNWGQTIAPKASTVNAKSNFTNNFGQPLPKPLSNAKSNFTNNWGRSSTTSPNISTDGTALTSSLSRNAATSSFSPTPGTTFSSTQGNALSSVVNTPTLGTDQRNQKLDLAGTNPDDYITNALSYAVAPQTELEKAGEQRDDVVQRLLDSMNDVPDQAAIDKKLRRQLGIEQKQQEVTNLTGKLNEIVNRGQAQQLAQVGQGRGIPEAIIGGIQAQIGRETAIAALPVQAQLQAAQGDLEMANDSLDRLFKIYSEDAQNRYNARNKSLEMIVGFLDKKEERLWQEQKTQNEREYAEKQQDYQNAQKYASIALSNNQSTLAGKIMNLDYKSPTFKAELSKLISQVYDPSVDLDRQIKQAQLNKLTGTGGREIVKVNGVDYYQNSDGSLSEILLPGNDQKAVSLKGKINLIDEIIKSPALDSAVGTSILSRGAGTVGGTAARFAVGAAAGGAAGFSIGGIGAIPGALVGGTIAALQGSKDTLTGQKQNFIAATEQLISKEFLDNLISVKAQGATFGALQKAEQDALTNAASKIGFWRVTTGSGEDRKVIGYNASESDFVSEVNLIKSLAQTAYERAGGDNAQNNAVNEYLDSISPALEGTSTLYLQAGYNIN